MVDKYDEQLILGFIEGDLSPEQEHAFKLELMKDARLRNLVAQLVEDRDALRAMPAETPPDSISEQIELMMERSVLLGMTSAAPAAQEASAQSRLKLVRVATYVAVAALVLVVASMFANLMVDAGSLFTTVSNDTEQSADVARSAETPDDEASDLDTAVGEQLAMEGASPAAPGSVVGEMGDTRQPTNEQPEARMATSAIHTNDKLSGGSSATAGSRRAQDGQGGEADAFDGKAPGQPQWGVAAAPSADTEGTSQAALAMGADDSHAPDADDLSGNDGSTVVLSKVTMPEGGNFDFRMSGQPTANADIATNADAPLRVSVVTNTIEPTTQDVIDWAVANGEEIVTTIRTPRRRVVAQPEEAQVIQRQVLALTDNLRGTADEVTRANMPDSTSRESIATAGAAPAVEAESKLEGDPGRKRDDAIPERSDIVRDEQPAAAADALAEVNPHAIENAAPTEVFSNMIVLRMPADRVEKLVNHLNENRATQLAQPMPATKAQKAAPVLASRVSPADKKEAGLDEDSILPDPVMPKDSPSGTRTASKPAAAMDDDRAEAAAQRKALHARDAAAAHDEEGNELKAQQSSAMEGQLAGSNAVTSGIEKEEYERSAALPGLRNPPADDTPSEQVKRLVDIDAVLEPIRERTIALGRPANRAALVDVVVEINDAASIQSHAEATAPADHEALMNVREADAEPDANAGLNEASR